MFGALVASLLFVGTPATAEQGTHRIAPGAVIAGCPHGMYSLAKYRHFGSRMYRRKSVSRRAHVRAARLERCQRSAWGRSMARRYHRRFVRERAARREEAEARAQIAALTPFSCSFGRFAIPCSIVRCESTDGSWDTENSIGAKGPYQFLGKRIPWPVRSQADRLAHHRLARQLWAGGAGAHHWQQCL